ncbi:uncharacterized protein MONBRDRAFT_29759 [Monosiga brevicollis MX1]|uniref:Fungal lipase-type domain-containing protein n=1 Tax=Monosiga brevicollis TaxID=81824 RepID=A9VC17_MONBE|nr:uncharacterized protein MONBRDRAFT_29759 [Monosiga brevicollis MX1]EDQ84946.1 predicted protein [Monosiga brevicollis MX1]|eukprot:XP_001750287.1 hypothetical protein [Monosiga brevicollis MX1]
MTRAQVGLAAALLALLALSGSVVGFSEQVHRGYLAHSWAAYCPPEQLANWSCYWCQDNGTRLVDTVYDNRSRLYGYVAYNPINSTIIVSFRGSSNVANWLYDFDTIRVTLNDTDVHLHAGFYAAWTGVRGQVNSMVAHVVMTLCPTCNRIINVGHSLGAAVAGLSSLELAVALPHCQSELHTFGMPRTGDVNYVAMARRMLSNITRMVHQADIVPHLPPQEFGFAHLPAEVWNLSNNTAGIPQKYVLCDGSGEDPGCSDSVPFWDWSASNHDTYMGLPDSQCNYVHATHQAELEALKRSMA